MVRVRELAQGDLGHVLDHAGRAWPGLRGSHVIITGANGFVGSWMTETLLYASRVRSLGVAVTAVVRDASAFRARFPHLAAAPRVAVVEGDVRTVRLPARFTHVVHCASAATPAENAGNPERVADMIVTGAANLLSESERVGGVRFLQMSSGSVYGPQPPDLDRIPETYAGEANPLVPAQRFGAAKLAAERRGLESVKRGTAFVAARGFALVGPRLVLDGAYAIGNFIGAVLAGKPIEIGGDGTPIRSWMYAADLAAWCWMILAHGVPGSAYNVGSDEAMTIDAAAARVAVCAASSAGIVRRAEPVPGARAARFVPDIARARAELGVSVWIPFDDAVARTISWWRQ